MLHINVPYKEICKIPGMEDYKDYYIDIKGNVYSTKRKIPIKLSPKWAKYKVNPYQTVLLHSKGKKPKSFYIHHLVSRAFLTEEHKGDYLTHRNGDRTDNSLENIVWVTSRKTQKTLKKIRKKTDRIIIEKTIRTVIHEKTFELKEETLRKIDLVHRASIEKGLHMSDSFTFLNEVIEEMLDEYCSRKGLKKIIYRLENHSN